MGWKVKYIEKIERAKGTKSFRFERPEDLDYKPGQYFFIQIPDKEGGRELLHHFSFSTSPTDSYIEFTTRIRESDFKQRMDELPPNTYVRINEVIGKFTLSEEMEKAAFLCGGIGITAARSNIRWALDSNVDVDIVLLYANKSLGTTAFKKELTEFEGENENFRVVYIMSEPEEDWEGSKGHIDSEFIEKNVGDWKDRTFFISGPPGFNKAIKKIVLEELELPDEQVRTEDFLGY